MNPRLVDRTGMRYGRLTAQKKVGNDRHGRALWQCVCDCGTPIVVSSCSLSTGNTASCGCLLRETITKHGGTGKGSYNTWRAMMRRCYNSADKDYQRYGAVGVVVDPSWHKYENFARDMGEPVGNQSLDRIDPYGGYCAQNCRWATPTTQARNIRVPATSKSGVVGVAQSGSGWIARLQHQKRCYISKRFATKEEAIAERKRLEIAHWGK